MKQQATREFRAARGPIWAALVEPARVASLVPGVESVDAHGETCTARVRIPLGVGELRMSLTFEVVERREPDFVKVVTTGVGPGIVVRVESLIELEQSVGATGTSLHWDGDVRLAGPSGSMGRRVAKPIVAQQLANVLDALDQQLSEPSRPKEVDEHELPSGP